MLKELIIFPQIISIIWTRISWLNIKALSSSVLKPWNESMSVDGYAMLNLHSVLQHVLSMDPVKLGYTEQGHCVGQPHPNLPGPQRLQWDIPTEVRDFLLHHTQPVVPNKQFQRSKKSFFYFFSNYLIIVWSASLHFRQNNGKNVQLCCWPVTVLWMGDVMSRNRPLPLLSELKEVWAYPGVCDSCSGAGFPLLVASTTCTSAPLVSSLNSEIYQDVLL